MEVVKAEIVNILEEHVETLHFKDTSLAKDAQTELGPDKAEKSRAGEIKLGFRGFEIKTVRLTVASGKENKLRGVQGGDEVKLDQKDAQEVSEVDEWIKL